MDSKDLAQQNLDYSDTKGVSGQNKSEGFLPAFCDIDSGRIEIARLSDGTVAAMHVMTGLPGEWAQAIDDTGNPCELKTSIVAGFVKNGVFYTRDEAIQACEATDL